MSKILTTWYDLIKEEMTKRGEDFTTRICTLSEEQQLSNWDKSGYPECFTAWGQSYVYFPVECKGFYFVGSAPRHPCDESTEIMG
jgi:hypothetical protein